MDVRQGYQPPSPKYFLAALAVIAVAFGAVKAAEPLFHHSGGGRGPASRTASTSRSARTTNVGASGSATSAPSQPTTSAPADSSTSTLPSGQAAATDRQAIANTLQRYRTAFANAFQHPNRPVPDLSDVASPAVVAGEQGLLQQLVRQQVHVLPAPDSQSPIDNLTVDNVTIAGTTATASTCAVNNWWYVIDATGQVLNTTPSVDTTSWIFTRQPNGSWIITASKDLTHAPGATACPAPTGH